MEMYTMQRGVRKIAAPFAGKPTSRYVRRAALVALVAAALGAATAAVAAPLTVPNSDFSDSANDGSIGGGLLGASGSGPIGSGPWHGSYAGVLALLAPPVVTVGSGEGVISSLSVNVLGINNQGAFTQALAAPYVADKHYVLAADVDAGTTLLGLELLTGGNAGLALTRSGTVLASTQSGGADIGLSLGSGQKYHVALGFNTGGTVSGNIGVALFSDPAGVLSANLQSQIVFGNVHLTQAPIPALPPASVGPAGGTPQGAMVNTAFSDALSVTVVDAEGDPLEGVTVTFSAPASGASATLSDTTVVTDVGGRATVTGVANGIAGSYQVTASVDGVGTTAVFDLTNTASGQPPISGTGANGAQATTIGTAFSCMLAVKVLNGAAPAAGATVVFQAPATGASSVLADGTHSGQMLVETTNASGVAAVTATANSTAGSYSVVATATGLTSGPLATPVMLASWPMTNLAEGDQIMKDGFDPVPDLCGSF